MSDSQNSLKEIHIYEQIIKYNDEYISSLGLSHADSLYLRQSINLLKKEISVKSENIFALDKKLHKYCVEKNQNKIEEFIKTNPDHPYSDWFISFLYKEKLFESLDALIVCQSYNKEKFINGIKDAWDYTLENGGFENITIEHVKYILNSPLNKNEVFDKIGKIDNFFLRIKSHLEENPSKEYKTLYVCIFSLMNINNEEELIRLHTRNSKYGSYSKSKTLIKVLEKDMWDMKIFYANLYFEINDSERVEFLKTHNIYLNNDEKKLKIDYKI